MINYFEIYCVILYSSIYGLFRFGFMAYQPLLVIHFQIFFYIYTKYMIGKNILQIHRLKDQIVLSNNKFSINQS